MNETDKAAFVSAWIASQKAQPEEKEQYLWAIDAMFDIPDKTPELAWELILRIYEHDKSPEVLGALTAGPIEDLMEAHGKDFIERVEGMARNDPLFRNIMSNVWLGGTDKSEWKRFYEAAGIPPFHTRRTGNGG
jgi:hypothetical protein